MQSNPSAPASAPAAGCSWLLTAASRFALQAVWRRPKWATGSSAPISGEAEEGLIDEDSLIDPSDTYKAMGKGERY